MADKISNLKKALDELGSALIVSEQQLAKYERAISRINSSGATTNLHNNLTKSIRSQSTALATLRQEYTKLAGQMRSADFTTAIDYYKQPQQPLPHPKHRIPYTPQRQTPLADRGAVSGPGRNYRDIRGMLPLENAGSTTATLTAIDAAALQATQQLRKFGSVSLDSFRTAEVEAEKLKLKLTELQNVPQSNKPLTLGSLTGVNPGQKETNVGGFTQEQLNNLAKKYPEVSSKIREFGMEMSQLKGVQVEASTGQERFNFQMTDANNVTRNLSLTTNKYGKVLVDTQKRFKSFGASIARNIGEVFKWAIAAQLVWIPMRKLQEISGEMIELQTKLASAAIATGQAFSETTKIFESAYAVSKETGTALSGVIEGYELAYRAAGRYGEGAERNQKATVLLRDAMLLASVTTLDEAKAIDTLAGGLLQLGRPLDEGIDLLDSWVAVSKNAAVSIDTLAESFAITAQSAGNAGIDLDSLNGYIAVLAENTTLSATEVGNAFRSFVTGYATDTAVKELSSLGFAVENMKGEALDFDHVMQQVYSRFKAGELSDADLNRVGVAIGGGNRRATQFITLLENLDRQQQLVGVSASASGDAEAALATQMQTVTKSLINLENSFKRLAQTLGTDGGFLDGIKLAVDGITLLLDGVSELTKIMGNSLPIMIAFGAAFARNGDRFNSFSGGLNTFGAGLYNNTVGKAFPNQQQYTGTSPYPLRNQIYGQSKGSQAVGKAFGTFALPLASTAIQAGGSFASGQTGRGAGQVAGGLAGAAIGSLAGPAGALVGQMIGSAAAGALGSKIWDYQYDWQEFFHATVGDGVQDALDEITWDPSKALEYSAAELGTFMDQLTEEAAGNWFTQLGLATASLFEGTSREQATIKYAFDEEQLELLRFLQDLVDAKGATNIPVGDAVKNVFADTIAQQEQAALARLNKQVVGSEVSSKRFKTLSSDIGGFGDIASNIIGLVGDEFIALNDEISTTEEAYASLFDFFYYASEDQMSQVAGMIGTMAQYEEAVRSGIAVSADQTATYERLRTDFPKYLQGAGRENDAKRVQIPSIVDLTGIRSGDFETVMEYAEERMSDIWAAMPAELKEGLEMEDWQNAVEPFLVELEDGTFRVIRDATSEALQAGAKIAEEEGAIASALSAIGISDYSQYTKSEFESRTAGVPGIAKNLQDAYGYEPEFEEQIVLFKDGFASMTLEQTITNLILKDILDTQEDQLEGIYNLPSDGTFFVPFQGQALAPRASSGGGAGGVVTDLLNEGSGAKPPETIIAEAASTITEATQKAFNERPVGTLESVFGPMPGTASVPQTTPYVDPRGARPSDRAAYDTSGFDVFENLGETYGGGGGIDFIQGTRGLLEKLREVLIGALGGGLINEGKPIGVGEGAGVGDVFQGLLGLESLSQLGTYFSSGQFREDALKDAPSAEESFGKIIEVLQGLEIFSPYGTGSSGKGIDVGETLKQLFQSLTKPTINLDISHNTNLQLDGKTLATDLSSYLGEFLLDQEVASGDIAKQVVI